MARLLLVSIWLAGCGMQQPAKPKKLEWVQPPAQGEVSAIVKSELERAQRDGRRLLVYVGATWCEPCQRFHRAAQAGKLDSVFGNLRLLDFDADRDGERLASAGYVSRLIPLFAAPNPDGRASGRQIEGSIKGDGAVDQIVPRLASLLRP